MKNIHKITNLKNKIGTLVFAVLLIALSTACSGHQPGYYDNVGDDNMEENNVTTEPTRTPQPTQRPRPTPMPTPSRDELLAQQARWDAEFEAETAEWNRINVSYIVWDSFFTPAPDDADLRTIERFVYVVRNPYMGHTFVIDRTHGRVYYDPHWTAIFLESIRHSADFREKDLDRLIETIKNSNLRNWPDYIEGERRTDTTNWGSTWTVGIKFSDGSILRRSGSGAYNSHPPQDQWDVFINFIDTLGQEIIERHAAETAQTEEESQDE